MFGNLKRTINATQAVNEPLYELTGDLNKIHADIRRFAIATLKEGGGDQEFIRLTARMFANVIVALHINHDCNEVAEAHWPDIGQVYRLFGDVMVSLGLKPKLIWPTYDAANAPDWAKVKS